MNLYTIVTNDEYEFPIKCDVKAREAADFLGTTTGNVRNMVLNPRKRSRYKVIISGKVKFNKREYCKIYAMTHDRSEYFKKRYAMLKEEKRRR